MLLFCPTCGNMLNMRLQVGAGLQYHGQPQHQQRSHRMECPTCPFRFPITRRYYERRGGFARRDRDEDVFGGPGAWDNAPKTRVQCPRPDCDGEEAAFFEVQIRSADEPMTGFFKCMACGNRWREG